MPKKVEHPEILAFGHRLRTLRQEHGLTQKALGELAGLHPTYIGGIERAERNPGLQNVLAIARGLGVKPAELFRYSQPSP